MGKKVYAVRVGREVGLFYTWEECSASVTRFKGAVYRGFKCKKSAERYLGIAPPRVHPPWLIQFDGGSSLEDSVAGAGWVIYRGGEEVASGSVALPPGNTNNDAEYAAAILALEEAVEMGLEEKVVVVEGDSMLVIKQTLGEWEVKSSNLVTLNTKLKGLVGRFESITLHHVFRESNKRADQLATAAMNGNKVRAI